MLADKGLRLDAVVELKVDPDILVRRIANWVEQMKLRGEPLRPDDNPEVLKQRLAAYDAQTAPLVEYYRGKGALRTVDGMASIDEVASAVGRALADAAFRPMTARMAGRKAAGAGCREQGCREQGASSCREQEVAGQGQAGQTGPPPRQAGAASQGAPQGSPAPARRNPAKKQQSRALAEVDEVRKNPLISSVFRRTQFERCRPQGIGEGVALPLAMAFRAAWSRQEFGTGSNGKARRRQPEQE